MQNVKIYNNKVKNYIVQPFKCIIRHFEVDWLQLPMYKKINMFSM